MCVLTYLPSQNMCVLTYLPSQNMCVFSPSLDTTSSNEASSTCVTVGLPRNLLEALRLFCFYAMQGKQRANKP